MYLKSSKYWAIFSETQQFKVKIVENKIIENSFFRRFETIHTRLDDDC